MKLYLTQDETHESGLPWSLCVSWAYDGARGSYIAHDAEGNDPPEAAELTPWSTGDESHDGYAWERYCYDVQQAPYGDETAGREETCAALIALLQSYAADAQRWADVPRSYHQGWQGGGRGLPMVNVKNHGWLTSEVVEQVRADFGHDDGFSLAWCEQRYETDEHNGHYAAWEYACADGWEMLANDAEEAFPGHRVTVESAGRSGGWCVVHGLPPLDDEGMGAWDRDLLDAWDRFASWAEGIAEDQPRRIAWYYGNVYEAEQEEAERAARERLFRTAHVLGLRESALRAAYKARRGAA